MNWPYWNGLIRPGQRGSRVTVIDVPVFLGLAGTIRIPSTLFYARSENTVVP
jgi:hypothetical protein